MSELVDPAKIEAIVGAHRHPYRHLAYVVSEEDMMYVLHSIACVEIYGDDLRDCMYSTALDQGADQDDWTDYLDCPVHVEIKDGKLVPCRTCVESDRKEVG